MDGEICICSGAVKGFVSRRGMFAFITVFDWDREIEKEQERERKIDKYKLRYCLFHINGISYQ